MFVPDFKAFVPVSEGFVSLSGVFISCFKVFVSPFKVFVFIFRWFVPVFVAYILLMGPFFRKNYLTILLWIAIKLKNPREKRGLMYSIEHSILDYTFIEKDLSIYNPYLKKLKKIIDDNNHMEKRELADLLISQRPDIVSEYSFTIPYYDILKNIASYSPLVEIGAGSGYWARCLSEFGADVIAYDSFPPGEQSAWEWEKGNSWFDDTWFGIIEGDETSAAHHPERTLLLAWPMPMNSMAYNTLIQYKNAGGGRLIYIGDPNPASSGDEHFYRELEKHKLVEKNDLYGWPGIHEKLLIYSLV